MTVRPQDLTDEAIELVRCWLDIASELPVDTSASRLAGVLSDPKGLAFTIGFVDGVVRPDDLRSAAKALRELAPLTPGFLPAPMRAAMVVGGATASALPGVVVPIARTVLRSMVGHLILDASDRRFGRMIGRMRGDGVRLNLNLLGEAVLGAREAQRRLDGTRRLLDRDDVDYVSVKVSAAVAPHNHWAFDETVGHVIEVLAPLYARAAAASPAKFINLDMEEYRDLDLTLAVFTGVLERPEFRGLSAGIALQAYLPDALGAMMRLQEWAARRVAGGGAPIKVRVVKGANLPMELVDAAIHGWPSAIWPTKRDSDTGYKAVLDYALTAERVANVRVGAAGHNLFDVALAWLLARARGAAAGLDIEMLLGMATAQAEAVKAHVGSLLLYTPVVHPEEFDVAISYLVRRLEEGAGQDNFMSAVFSLSDDAAMFERERRRFVDALSALESITGDGDLLSYRVPEPNRRQDRTRYDEAGARARIEARVAADAGWGFANTPDTDPCLPANRRWARDIAGRMVSSTLGVDLAGASLVGDIAALDGVIGTGVAASAGWRAMAAEDRARILHRAGELLEARRGDLLEVMGSECGKTLDQSDPEVSEAIDFAHYYAMLGVRLERVDGARARRCALVAVIPPWNFPLAIPAGGVFAGLASGASVVVKPASAAVRVAALLVETLWDAGVPHEVLQFVRCPDRRVASALVADPRVDRLILTGAYETAASFRALRRDLPILAETSGKNAIIVTPSADLDLAVKDVVASAFGHAGQKCSAASLVVLVGSVATSTRFRGQLLDAVRSLRVGTPEHLDSQMGPIIAAPSGKLLRGLTTLGPGESWLVQPSPLTADSPLALDTNGGNRLWSPGVRDGVRRGSEYHLTEYFGPILGIMTAENLDEAIDIVNETDYGLTSGLHSLDPEELAVWLNRVQAGNLYVNRGITGAVVRRQPFGGWKKSAIGTGAKAGGPNYLHGLVDWSDARVREPAGGPGDAVAGLLAAVAEGGIAEREASGDELSWLRAAIGSDAKAWEDEFGCARDVSQLGVERNLLRYRPVPVIVRAAADAPAHQVIRVVAAGLAAGAQPTLSTQVMLPDGVRDRLAEAGVIVLAEDGDAWRDHLVRLARRDGPDAGVRVRIVAGRSRADVVAAAFESTGGKPDVAIFAGPVVSAGRVEMLTYLREQSVCITAHRFGTAAGFSEGVI